ncbi:hypothetical protein BCR43DRAFT_563934 [Syncephalastrum racemosum]|uniref:Uncharacterized protein n=1 Tax=Syncephalastrum racemosum TaxID=13706 RepID=A0A1X2HCZ8_SYNRA|nr:hypothetical protein BCR43DRAFT_563934 [Syncephalastrum racemosum]
MRTISLVNRLKWSFSGNMNPHALVLGDVDNDGYNEFVIGNLSGDLAIFKGECSQGLPTFMCRGLGTITCIAVGDVRNCGKNSVVCINAEGHAHIFDIPRQHPVENEHNTTSGEDYLRHQQQARRGSDTSSIRAFRRLMATTTGESEQIARDTASGIPGHRTSSIYDLQKPNLTLKVPVNVNKILIADVDGDTLNEIILARTDRILHAFQLASSPDANNNFQTENPQAPRGFHTPSLASASTSASSSNTHKQQAQAPAASLQSSLSNISGSNKDKTKAAPPSTSKRSSLVDSKDKSNVLRKGMAWSTSSKQKSSTDAASQQKQKQEQQQQQTNPEKMYLLDKDIWVFDGQITSLSTTMHPTKPNEPILLVAQPGNTFTIIDCEGNRFNPDMTPQYSQRAQYTQYHRQKRRSVYGQSATAASSDVRSDDAKKNEDDLELTPKAREGPFSNFKRATRTIRTFLQRGSMREEEASVVPPELEADNLVVSCEEGGTSKIRDISGNEFKRSNFVVPNWPVVDGDDIIGDEENGAVATEIVIGQRHPTVIDPETGEMCKEDDGSQVGMLSMDGKFTIYDLRKQEVSQHDLFVTHKLFSLATLDISCNSSLHNTPGIATPISLHPSYHSPNGSPHLRFPSPSTAAESYSSFNGNNTNNHNSNNNNHKNEPMSSGASPALSSSSRLSRVTTNASNANPDVRPAENHLGDQRSSSRGELEVAPDVLERVPSKTEESLKGDVSRRESLSSTLESDLEDEDDLWSEDDESETDEEAYPESDLFVACAWNGVTYLIDWSKRLMDDEENDAKNKIKFQLVKFAFEGRVCAFTAGLYAVTPGRHVPCLFYVDFEDQIFVYYDVRVSPGPVSGFIDNIDDDIEEALERIVGFESEIKALVHSNVPATSQGESDTDDELIDLGDGWKGALDGNVMFDDGALSKHRQGGSPEEILEDILDTEQLDLAEFIHECLYDSEDLRDRLEEQIMALEKKRVSHHHHHQLSDGMDLRRLSDLNITLEPSRDSADSASETDGLLRPPSQASSFSNSSLNNDREGVFED